MITLQAGYSLQGSAGTGADITYTVSGDSVSSGTDTFEVLGQGQLGTTAAAMLSAGGGVVPASTIYLISDIHLANTTNSGINITLYVVPSGSAAATNQLTGTFTIPANGWANYTNSGWLVFNSSGQEESIGSSTTSTGTGLNGWLDITQQVTPVLTTNSAATNLANINTILAGAKEGSIIWFPAGTYLFSGAWNSGGALPSSFTFMGSYGESYVGMTANVAGNWITANTSTGNPTAFIGMNFFSSGVQQTAGFVLEFGNSLQPIVQNCEFSGNGGTHQMFGAIGMHGTNSGNGGIIENCNFGQCNGNTIELAGGQGSTVIANCLGVGTTVSGTGAVGVSVTTTSGTANGGGVVLANNDFIGYTNNFSLSPVASTTLASVYAINCFFDQGVSNSIQLTGAGTINHFRLVGCWMTGAATMTSGSAISISTTSGGGPYGVEIDSCYILNLNGSTTSTGITATDVGDISITSCEISNWTTGVSITAANTAGATKVNMVGNVVGPSNNTSGNGTGILLNAGSVAYGAIHITANQLSGNTTANLTNSITTNAPVLPAEMIIFDNAGTGKDNYVARNTATQSVGTTVMTAVTGLTFPIVQTGQAYAFQANIPAAVTATASTGFGVAIAVPAGSTLSYAAAGGAANSKFNNVYNTATATSASQANGFLTTSGFTGNVVLNGVIGSASATGNVSVMVNAVSGSVSTAANTATIQLGAYISAWKVT